jgi:quercetin dioxygenase-like cupin family protein
MESKLYLYQNEIPVEELGGGVSRQILGYNENMMMVKVIFEKDAIGYLHQHPHTQTTYCAMGAFEFTIGTEKQIIKAGDATYIPPGISHGVLCLEKGILIDTFNPHRADFISK